MVWCLINLSGEPGAAHSDPTFPPTATHKERNLYAQNHCIVARAFLVGIHCSCSVLCKGGDVGRTRVAYGGSKGANRCCILGRKYIRQAKSIESSWDNSN